MIIIPKEVPIISGLNSYYLDVARLFEHYQGVLDTFCVHFQAPVSEGAVFFDDEGVLNGIYHDKNGTLRGPKSIDYLTSSPAVNFNVSVYKLPADRVYYWANLPNAKPLYKDLTTEFTDLEGLIRNLTSDKVTGYVDVTIDGGTNNGLIFMLYGMYIGSYASWEPGIIKRSKDYLETMIQKSRTGGGVFHVRKISLSRKGIEDVPSVDTRSREEVPGEVLAMLGQMLAIFERLINGTKKVKIDFDTALKRKFVEKVDRFDFLDPFAAEFRYAEGTVEFLGDATSEELVQGVIESIREIASENGILPILVKHLNPWAEKYAELIEAYNIAI
ncbi:MAG: hypothetical protein CSA22_01560 [Deltaproteobacteria bacterium]|nr:MAG: hypothetical protein CSA22_01560 [Deltaproteobacteria bacterium]